MIPANSRLRKKVRVVVSVLALLAAWPIGHRALVIRYDVNPWRLYGWSMYCVPQFETKLQFLANPKGKEDRKPHPTRYPIKVDGAAQILRSYKVLEAGIGSLASTDALAAIVFEGNPVIGRVTIRVMKSRFDVETAMPVMESRWVTYDRP